jgi:hypothetical protein
METKILEIRDARTFIAVLCVNMQSSGDAARHYYLRRYGYPCDGRPNIGMTTLSADGDPFCNDPYGWNNRARTRPMAHKYIIEHWEELKDGDVVDVQFILGETDIPKISERLSNTVDSGARR